MALKIEDVIAGKSEQESVTIDGVSVPVKALKNLFQEGYENLRVYAENKTFSIWGKTCSACFTPEHFMERAKSK
jgi:hypothetical protein